MRIVHTSGWFFPDSVGGTEAYVAGLATRLSTKGHEVVVAAPTQLGEPEQRYTHNGLHVYRYRIPTTLSRSQRQGRQPVPGTDRFHRWVRQYQPGIVHFHTFLPGLGSDEVRACRDTGARVVATSHTPGLGFLCQRGTMFRWGEHLCDGLCQRTKCAACELQHRGLPKPLAWTIGALPSELSGRFGAIPGKIGSALGMSALIGHNQRRQEELLRLVDRLVVLTQWARQTVVANGCPPERVELNRLGHSHYNLTAKPGPDLAPTRMPIRVGYVGRFDPLKGVADLILAGRALPGDREIQFELVGPLPQHGNEPYYRHLRRLADRDSRFVFRHTVSPAQVPELLASYDLLVTPSLCTEGGPTVAIEAHAKGTPVIGTPLGGLSELIEDTVNGRLFPPRDHRALARILKGIIRDPGGTIDHWRNNLPAARHMDDIVEDYLRLYENVLAPSTETEALRESRIHTRPIRPQSVRGDLTEHGKPQTAKDTQSCHPMSVSL